MKNEKKDMDRNLDISMAESVVFRGRTGKSNAYIDWCKTYGLHKIGGATYHSAKDIADVIINETIPYHPGAVPYTNQAGRT